MKPPPVPPLPGAAPSAPPLLPVPGSQPMLSPEKTLRRLFLTLFLRGRSARGLQRQGAPQGVWQKLTLVLFLYFVMGCFTAIALGRQSIFALSLYVHGATLMFLGMFVASSAGEVLFNQQEADILLHRPVSSRMLLWSKITVLLQVSLWLAGAYNLVALVVGIFTPGGGWLFPLAHICSTVLEALFCTGTVVLIYQLCLRWFGRERLDGLMTTAQVLVGVMAVAGGQIIPRLMGQFGELSQRVIDSWWLFLLPPAWFTGFDDAIAGSGNAHSWLLAAVGIIISGTILWLAFGKLADNYISGLQSTGEGAAPRPAKGSRQRWLGRLVSAPPLSWWLRDSISRASFQLTIAYLTRDRDMKLRIYPGVAPMLVMPVIMLIQTHGRQGSLATHGAHGAQDAAAALGGFPIAFMGVFLGLVPMVAMGLLQYSQHWQAADLFRVAPQIGPASLYHGARKAVMLFLVLPLVIIFGGVGLLVFGFQGGNIMLMVPGIILLPLYALIPGVLGRVIPLSQPIESAKSASRGLSMVGVMILSFIVAGLASLCWYTGFFGWFLLAEALVAAIVYVIFRQILKNSRWPSME